MPLSTILPRSLQTGGLWLAVLAATGIMQATAAPQAPAEWTAGRTGTPAPSAPSKPQAAALQRLIQDAQLQCSDAVHGEGCIAGNLERGDFYDVTPMPDCGAPGVFAGMSKPEGATVLSEIPTTGSHARVRATLAQDRRLCIQAVARAGQQPRYFYVVEVPPNSEKYCRDRMPCASNEEYAKEASLSSHDAGHAITPGHLVSTCMQGWVDAEAVEIFDSEAQDRYERTGPAQTSAPPAG